MADVPAQGRPSGAAVHLVLYDGVCGLCNGLVQFLLRHDRRSVFVYAPLQSDTGRAVVADAGGDPTELTTFYVVADYRSSRRRLLDRSNAALFVAGRLGWPWKAAAAARVFPRAIRDRAYDLIARNRYRWFGRYEQCLAPRPEFRGRFIE